jgi:23S rRNA U2552 (ribose-2'-O)-methylase RlmE/FtsJ
MNSFTLKNIPTELKIFDLKNPTDTIRLDNALIFEEYKKYFNTAKSKLWDSKKVEIYDIFKHTKSIYPINSNASQKIREMFDMFKTVPSSSFHNAEFPGGFVKETIRCYPEVKWMISSWMPKEQTTAITDKYHLYKTYPENFITLPSHIRDNPMEDGNLTKLSECQRIYKEVLKRRGNGVDLYTSDGGIETNDYLNQESATFVLKIGEAIVGLNVLKPGGTMILKFYTCFEENTRSLILHLCMFFNKYYIVKPATSRITNSEIYFVGMDFISVNPPELSESDKTLILANLYDAQKYLGDFQLQITKLMTKKVPSDIVQELNEKWQEKYFPK